LHGVDGGCGAVGCVLAAIDFRFLRYLNTDKTRRPCRFYLRHFRCVTAIDSVAFSLLCARFRRVCAYRGS
jgi:hypothetical protein